jgi:diguanylate cyclase (GGDEF)-like protein/PAS domain S-box-containing protein
MPKSANNYLNNSETVFFAISTDGLILYKSPNFDVLFHESNSTEDILSQVVNKDRAILKKLFENENTETISLINSKVTVRASVSIVKANDKKFVFIETLPETDSVTPILDKITQDSFGIITFLDKEGTRLYVSPSVEKTFDVDRKFLLGRSIFEDVHPSDLPRARELFTALLQKPGSIKSGVIFRLRNKNDTWLMMEGSAINLTNIPDIGAIVINSRNVTEIHKMHNVLKEYQYKVDGLVQQTEAAVFMKDLEGRYLICNSALSKLMNMPKRNILGCTDEQLFPDQTSKRIIEMDTKVIKTKKPIKYDESVIFPNGEKKDFVTNKFPLLDANKKVMGICCIAYDVTNEKETLRKLKVNEEYFKAIVQHSFDYTLILDDYGNKKFATESVQSVLGFSLWDYLQIPFFDNIYPEDADKLKQLYSTIISQKTPKSKKIEIRVKNNQGEWVWIQYVFDNLLKNKSIEGVVVHAINVNASKKSQIEFENQRILLQDFIKNNINCVVAFDKQMNVLFKNKQYETCSKKFSNFRKNIRDMLSLSEDLKTNIQQIKLQAGTKDFYYNVCSFPLKNSDGITYGYGVSAQDITVQKEQEIIVEKLAFVDNLTSAHNANAVGQELQWRIQTKSLFGLMNLDLYKFRTINDNVGSEIGDKIIQYFYQLIQQSVTEGEYVARYSGDEFLVLFANDDLDYQTNITKKIIEACKIPHSFESFMITLKPSIGVVQSSKDYTDYVELIRDVNSAVTFAKQYCSSNVCYFDNDVHNTVSKEFKIINNLQLAIARNELYLEFQPLREVASNNINFEALVRWQDIDLSVMKQEDATSLITDPLLKTTLDYWMISQVIDSIVEFKKELIDFSVHCNVHGHTIGSNNFVTDLLTQMKNKKINGKCIKLEIVGDLKSLDSIDIQKKILQLQKSGVEVVLDNFGNSILSLEYLLSLPVDLVKIDRFLTSDIHTSIVKKDLVTLMISTAHTLDKKVIVEGIDLEEQWKIIQDLNCDFVQGSMISIPLTLNQAITFSQLIQSSKL